MFCDTYFSGNSSLSKDCQYLKNLMGVNTFFTWLKKILRQFFKMSNPLKQSSFSAGSHACLLLKSECIGSALAQRGGSGSPTVGRQFLVTVECCEHPSVCWILDLTGLICCCCTHVSFLYYLSPLPVIKANNLIASRQKTLY